jgi:DNA/RNA-binding domain of Phe-tRNA-synthetase-like protein
MLFTIAPECRALGLRAGAIIFRNVRIGEADPGLRAEIQREAQAVRTRFADPQAVRSAPLVVAFADLLRKMGVNPRREQPSVERLLTFALKRGDLPAINGLVDAYNLVSVRTGCSLGAHDLDTITPPVSLRLLTGRESFTPLGSAQPEAIRPGLFGYVDASDRVLCRLDVLQADFSKVTERTTNALLIVEGTVSHPPETLRQAVADAVTAITQQCTGTSEVVALP